MSNAKEEKHRPERMNLIYYPTVYDRKTGDLIGQLVDLNFYGLKLVSRQPIEVGTEYTMRIELTPSVDGHKQIVISGKCVWSDNDINPDFHATGVEFNDVDDYNRDIIGRFIDKYRFASPYVAKKPK